MPKPAHDYHCSHKIQRDGITVNAEQSQPDGIRTNKKDQQNRLRTPDRLQLSAPYPLLQPNQEADKQHKKHQTFANINNQHVAFIDFIDKSHVERMKEISPPGLRQVVFIAIVFKSIIIGMKDAV